MALNFDGYNISESTQGALERYVEHKIEPGGFLTAVLSNNLVESFARADSFNQHNMKEIVSFIYSELPSNCWGSREIVNKWIGE